VIAWDRPAENIVEHARKGDRILVHGRLEQRDWATDAGESRTAWEITAEDIGLSLRLAVARGGASETGPRPPSNRCRSRPARRRSRPGRTVPSPTATAPAAAPDYFGTPSAWRRWRPKEFSGPTLPCDLGHACLNGVWSRHLLPPAVEEQQSEDQLSTATQRQLTLVAFAAASPDRCSGRIHT
jgi:single-stranded DNA-binding protein